MQENYTLSLKIRLSLVSESQNQVLRKEELSLTANDEDSMAVFGWFYVDRGCLQASDGSIKAVQCPAAEVVTQRCSQALVVPSKDLDTSNLAQECLAPPRKLLQRSMC